MVLPAHYFRSYRKEWLKYHFLTHVAWCARRVLRILGSPDSCDTQISDTHIPIMFHYNVFGLYISMDHSVVMHVLEPHYDASHHESFKHYLYLRVTSLFFIEAFFLSNVESEIAAS